MVARMVDVSMASTGKPCARSEVNVAGISARMYDMVVKVVSPANTSVFRLCCCKENPTSVSSFAFILSRVMFYEPFMGMAMSNLEPPW